MKVPRQRPIDRQLEAYEEAWKQDHIEAMRCRDFEETLAVGIAIFRALVQIDTTWRERVSRGVEEYSVEEDQALRASFLSWLRPCAQGLERLRYFETRFDAVEGSAEFRRCCEEAKEIVAEWKSPAPPVQGSEEENIVAHTDRALTTAELAQALDRVSKPSEQPSVPLGFDPDAFPLF